MEPYYYQGLTKAQQSSYQAMKAGLQGLAPSFPVPLLENGALTEVFMKLRLDCPQLFYAGTFQYRYYPDSKNAELVPSYLFEKGKIKEHQKALQARVEKLARPAAKLSDMEKLLYIHDFICKNVHYDKLKKQYSHEIIGPLGHGVGVCEGIAKAVKILCDALQIWCIIALAENNPEKNIKYRHAWNVVRLDKKYYHLDCTFDNSLGNPEEIRYDYFLLSDKQIFRDHEKLVWQIPACTDADRFYYKEKKRSFTKMEEVQKRSAQAVKKGKPLIFHWRGGYMTREIVQELLRIFKEEAAKREKFARVSLNWAQAVVRVQFMEQLPTQELTMEEANEGEKD
nr:transglutaminase domain-containing protein [uncultured Anaerotignum sp.]